MRTADQIRKEYEAKQQEIENLIDMEVEGRAERIEELETEIHELMREEYELTK